MKYNHVFTIIEFDITGTGTLAALTLSGASGANFAGLGIIDVSQNYPGDGIAYVKGGPLNLRDDVTVILTAPATLSPSVATKVYMVVNPGYAGLCNIAASKDGDTFVNLVTGKSAPGSGGFLRGHYYTVSLTGVTIP